MPGYVLIVGALLLTSLSLCAVSSMCSDNGPSLARAQSAWSSQGKQSSFSPPAGVMLFRDAAVLGILRLRGGDDEEEDLFADENAQDAAAAAELKAKAEAAKGKAKTEKEKPPAKTNIVLDVKGWGEETDMLELERCVREIEMDGLLWGAGGLEEVGYGIKKLRITCVVHDEKVSIDLLEEKITALEDLVQSVDIAAMNKI